MDYLKPTEVVVLSMSKARIVFSSAASVWFGLWQCLSAFFLYLMQKNNLHPLHPIDEIRIEICVLRLLI